MHRSLAALLALLCCAVMTAHAREASGAPPVAVFDRVSYAGHDAVFERPLAPGHFRNPVLTGFHPDPSVVRVGEDYYLVNSTFGWFPGIPVFHSRDLVHWTQLGNAIDRPGMMPFGKDVGLGGGGIYAPTLRHHAGVFHVITTCVGCGGNFVVSAKDPAGPWSDPVWLPHIQGIDPSLFFDDDGRAYIVHHAEPAQKRYPAHTAIRVMEVDPVTFAPRSEDVLLVDGGVKQPWHTDYIEGPHLYKVDGRYYLSAAGGGTGYFHQQLAYRADRPFGPYEAKPDNPILTQHGLPDERPDPVTATGHADLVQDPAGDWWAVFLGTRIYDLATPPQDPGRFHTGRETFLLPVRWDAGWPVILAKGQALPWTPAAPAPGRGEPPAVPVTGNFGWTEEFDGAELPPQWLFARTPLSRWWRTGDGALRIAARAQRIGANAQPSFIGRRVQHMTAAITAQVAFAAATATDEAGLLAVQNDDYYYAYGLGADAAGHPVLRVRRRAGAGEPADGIVVAERRVDPRARDGVELRIELDRGRIGFSYRLDGRGFEPLLADARADVLTTAVAGGFTGAVVGPYAQGTAE